MLFANANDGPQSNLPRLKLVPHRDGKLLGLLRRVQDHAPEVVVASPEVLVALIGFRADLVDGHSVEILL